MKKWPFILSISLCFFAQIFQRAKDGCFAIFHSINKRLKNGPITTIFAYESEISINPRTKEKVRSKLKLNLSSETLIQYASIEFMEDAEARYAIKLKQKRDEYSINYRLRQKQSGPFTLYLNGEKYAIFYKK